MVKRRCAFIDKPGGCRKGASCGFSHAADAPTALFQQSGFYDGPTASRGGFGPARALSSATWGRGGSSTAARPNRAQGRCNQFWAKGSCDFGMSCTYSHIANPNLAQDASRGTTSATSVLAAVEPAAANSITTDGLFVMARYPTAAEAQRQLRTMGDERARADSPQAVAGFAAVLLGANKSNEDWTENDRNLFRQELASTQSANLLLRLGEVVRFPTAVDGLMPFIAYLTSDSVLKSPVSREVNALFSVLKNNFDTFAEAVSACLDEYVSRGKVAVDTSTVFRGTAESPLLHSLFQVLKPLASLLDECLSRWRDAVVQAPELPVLVNKLDTTFRYWSTAVSAPRPTFEDSLSSDGNVLAYVSRRLAADIKNVLARTSRLTLVMREGDDGAQPSFAQAPPQASQGIIGHLQMNFRGPGGRHDNDFAAIDEISIAPTSQELSVGADKVYLPANIVGAPHHLTAGHPIERHLDIQFRLLREEAIAGLRQSVQLVLEDLTAPEGARTDLARVLKEHGGVYRRDKSFFGVFTGARFVNFGIGIHGFEISLNLQIPFAASRRSREFWDSKSGLSTGSLVALIWEAGGVKAAFSGSVASQAKDIAASAANGSVLVKIAFFDGEIAARVSQLLQRGGKSPTDLLLIKSDTLYPTLKSYLKALQNAEPTRFPFRDVLAPGPKNDVQIEPPAHAQLPGVKWDLKSLLPESYSGDTHFSATDEASVDAARELLRAESRLDPSQADAVMDILTRQVALLQGPPGTGKSFTGVELIRVLLANERGPILLMAYTNHALDHLLHAVVDSGITTNVVRLGSRSDDQLIMGFSLEELEHADTAPAVRNASRSVRQARGELKDCERAMDELSFKMRQIQVAADDLQNHIRRLNPTHLDDLHNPPGWIQDLAVVLKKEGWVQVDKKNKRAKPDPRFGFLDLWLDGNDLSTLKTLRKPPAAVRAPSTAAAVPVGSPEDPSLVLGNTFSALSLEGAQGQGWSWEQLMPPPGSVADADSAESDDDEDENVNPGAESGQQDDAVVALESEAAFVAAYGPLPVPSTVTRPLHQLKSADLWTMSLAERKLLYKDWTTSALADLGASQTREFSRLMDAHERAQGEFEDLRAQNRQRLLRSAEIIGCTTSGAAKLSTLIQGVSPKIVLVEEAGQTLEPHILANLTESVEHLILIGDPQQLRPSTEYELSIDNPRSGSLLYRFDVSLLERLAQEGLPMSQLQIQRRMQPEISSLIRAPLYPRLQDHELVLAHAPVKGMLKNVFFLDHQHAEGGAANDVSKHNAYEISMIVDLVTYLLRQGCYGHDRGVVVLCAYLGQLSKLRLALAGIVTVVVDQRDQDQLDLAGGDDETEILSARNIPLSQQVTLRTIDNYQGEEGDVVIFSTVRNDGGPTESRSKGTIGFLKTTNRVNVALSRARDGLYILGSASLLAAHSPFWQEVINLLQERDQVGPALPVVCATLPDEIQWISEPGRLPLVSPNGGCLNACDAHLPCGHLCTSSCHADDPEHVSIKCTEHCQRVLPCGHPCSRLCYVVCAPCQFPIKDVSLPCGHVVKSLPCEAAQHLDQVACKAVVDKDLSCGHSALVACDVDPASVKCLKACGRLLDCCGKTCAAACSTCQDVSAPTIASPTGPAAAVTVSKHGSHACDRELVFCPHRCTSSCSIGHECPPCKSSKVAVCEHGSKKSACSSLSEPCKAECSWACVHQGACSLPCGSPCDRLPCDVPCDKTLKCGCPCPSLCAEPCPKICLPHSPASILDQTADLLGGLSVRDLLLLPSEERGTLETLLVSLPCGHVFNCETCDGLVGLGSYYEQDQFGDWVATSPPPAGFAKLLACPSCRAPFFFRRYGRPIRKAALDILEQNLVHKSSVKLRSISQTLERASEADVIGSVGQLSSEKFTTAKLGKEAAYLQAVMPLLQRAAQANLPAPVEALFDDAKAKQFLGAGPLGAFKKAVAPFINAVRRAREVTQEKSAHSAAWDAAFASRYRQRIDEGQEDLSAALAESSQTLGLPPPLAKTRFFAEAVLLSIDARYTLVNVAHAFAERMPSGSKLRHRWTLVRQWILKTILDDAQLVHRVAARDKLIRYSLLSTVVVLRAKMVAFRFHCSVTVQASPTPKETMLALGAHSEEARQQAWAAFGASFPSDPIISLDGMDGAEFLEAHCQLPAERVMDDWAALSQDLATGDFHESITLAEKRAVLQAMRLGAGHWYCCPNGHPFAIGECGGAMETSTCPECGAVIGGAHHELAAGNAPSSMMAAAF